MASQSFLGLSLLLHGIHQKIGVLHQMIYLILLPSLKSWALKNGVYPPLNLFIIFSIALI